MFKKHKESFTCEQCGTFVEGNGYTNHCPECFTSKHVDVDPGDRAAECGGLMPVTAVELKKSKYVLVQTCEQCGHVRNNKVQEQDNMTKLAELQKELALKQDWPL